jgi:hypothetical protein
MKEEKQLNETAAEQVKKAYTKPVLSQIQLVAEEAVLALCKWGDGAGGRALCLPDRTCVSQRRS